MKVVWISPYLPLPVTTGGRRRISSLMGRLSSRHEITLVAYDRGEVSGARDASGALVHGVHTIGRRPPRSILNAALWAVGPWPFMAVANGFNRGMVRLLREVVDRVQPDVLHCEHFHLWQAVSRARKSWWPPVVLSQQGIEFLVTERFAKVPRSIVLKTGFRWELAKARRWEIAACRAADTVVVVSRADAGVLSQLLPRQRIRVVENGVDVEEFQPAAEGVDPASFVMLFVGTFSFFGNRDALRYLVAEILPAVQRLRPAASLRVIGEDPPVTAAPGVEYVGTVPHVAPHLQAARLLVAPLRTGSGTKLKLLEAMACGIPFITTSYGAEGIEGATDAGIIADDTRGFVEAAVRLIDDHTLAQRLGRRGREIATKSYSWDVSASALADAWEETRVSGARHGKVG